MIKANDYQKYFLDGDKHVGDYETMYRNCADPWHIEELGLRLDMKAALLLWEHSPVKLDRALDAGAGAGLFTLELLKVLKKTSPEVRLTVSDVAPSALALAKARLETAGEGARVDYVPYDLRRLDESDGPFEAGAYDLIVVAQVLWGLLENIRAVWAGLGRLARRGGRLLVAQHFPDPQNYGADVVGGPDDLARLIAEAGWRPLAALETDRRTNHHWTAMWSWN
ncbi:MAG: class I SAM-dependent methyltransferase [Deltaproteobacteria bacterium]|jgi:SAM-dependent methyltransferase|nr:class I SAM-dependent methyltransferase [Deltaproteobacteria bacterium]